MVAEASVKAINDALHLDVALGELLHSVAVVLMAVIFATDELELAIELRACACAWLLRHYKGLSISKICSRFVWRSNRSARSR